MAVIGTMSTLLALLVIGSYLWACSGWPVAPGGVVLVAVVGALAWWRWLAVGTTDAGTRDRDAGRGAVAAAMLVGLATLLAALSVAWPDLLPPGGASDLAHHLQLIDVLHRTRMAVTDPNAGALIGEMAHYTPGAHWLTVIAADLARVDPLRAVYPMLVCTIALKAALIVLIAYRALEGRPGRVALSVAAAALVCFAPRAYVIDGFLQAGFLAQVTAEVFLVAGWWGIVEWRARPSAAWLGFIGLMGAAVFLTWPIWIGPLMLTLALTVLTQPSSWSHRVGAITIAALPVMIVAALHLFAHAAWLRLAGTTGAVPTFDAGISTGVLIVLASAGAWIARGSVAARPVVYAMTAVLLQAAALWAVATMRGSAVPYMAFKMIYVGIYLAAILAAVALGALVSRTPAPRQRIVASLLALVSVVIAAAGLRGAPVPPSIASLDLAEAGTWAREHVPPSCVDYIVRDAEQAYWLHLAVLGQPRAEARIVEFDTYTANAAAGRWIEGRNRRYGIAQRSLLPGEVLQRVDVLHEAGSVVVFRDRTASAAADDRCVSR